MNEFTFYAPTEIVFGKGAEEKTGALVKRHGGTRVLVVYGGESAVKSGLLERLTKQLDAEGLSHTAFGGVKPNPTLSHAREGVRKAAEFKADFILAVGGGSVIDTSKAIAHGVKNPDTDIWKFWKREAALERSAPIGVVLTIPAAGSETSASAVITDEATNEKRGLTTDFNRPRFAAMNPELAFTLPKYQVACGAVDILMHTLDRFFSAVDGNETTDAISAALMRVIIKNGGIAVKNGSDYGAMSELMWCGSISHNGITSLGRPLDFSVHQMGMELGGRFDAAHGATLSAVWDSWARYVLHVNPARFAKYAADVWGCPDKSEEKAAMFGIEETVKFFRELDMPTCFTELGIGVQTEKTIDEVADSCVFHGARLVGNFKPLNKNDIIEIYRMANR